ncbi:glycosyltransferase [Fragilaria crotonensis]|nr:glycosyltransferase [Fragilaria crotonensis]
MMMRWRRYRSDTAVSARIADTVGHVLLLFLCFSLSRLAAAVNDAPVSETATTTESGSGQPHRRLAVVTLVTTSDYIAGAQVLVESLNRVNATGDRIALWVSSDEDDRSDLDETHVKQLLDAGWNKTMQLTKKDGTFTSCQVSDEQKAQIAASPEMAGLPRYWGTCSKFAIWALTDYDAVIYLDADSLALNNFDFVFDILLGQSENDDHSAAPPNFAAQGNTDCWEEPPPYNQCANFYTALLAVKPSSDVAKYLHAVANQQGAYLMHGELVLLNTVITQWYHLPRYTLVAQTEAARPWVQHVPSIDDGNVHDSGLIVDWSQVKVYDFAGPPGTKPWKTYWLQKKTGDLYLNAYLGRLSPDSQTFKIAMYPQWVWNDCYDAVLARLQKQQEGSATSIQDVKEEL